jgi:threonylcarbamoyladenosine tRNA methylthiotransferase MtaB
MTTTIHTFGCRLNTYESEVMKAHAEAAGIADTIIFNTCAVTAEAEKQARQAIRRARREHPNARIIVTGCAAQINPAEYAAMEGVDIVLGNHEKLQAGEWDRIRNQKSDAGSQQSRFEIQDSATPPLTSPPPQRHSPRLRGEPEGGIREGAPAGGVGGGEHLPTSHQLFGTEKIRVNDILSVKDTASHLVTAFDGRARAFLQIQNGCDHRCTFCIIPYGRGNSRSVPIGEVAQQMRVLVASGYQEIVFTGVDISAYGADLPGKPTLGQMVRRVLALVPELPRLRLSSIDAVEVDADLYRLIAEEPRLMPHLHVSLQAGDDMVLKRMKRRHLRDDILVFCEKVRALRPAMVFGADIIAGFPTETDAMFENTLTLVEEAGLTYLHVFPYSPRPGTPAAKMPQVAPALRKARATLLREAGAKQIEQHLARQVGKTLRMIVEQDGLSGHAEDFTPVRLASPEPVGALVQATITRADDKWAYAA